MEILSRLVSKQVIMLILVVRCSLNLFGLLEMYNHYFSILGVMVCAFFFLIMCFKWFPS